MRLRTEQSPKIQRCCTQHISPNLLGGLWKRVFACTCRQELTQSLVICGMTRTAGVSALVGVGCCVLFCLRSGWLQLLRNSWHTRVNNRRNHVGNKLRGMATTNWYAGLVRRSAVSCTYLRSFGFLQIIFVLCFVFFPPLMMRVSSSVHLYYVDRAVVATSQLFRFISRLLGFFPPQ